MQHHLPCRPAPGRREDRGYMLMVVLLMMAMLILVLATAAPRMTTEIQRQREKEMVFRAKQYVVGIQRYYHKFGAYPPNLNRLKQTNGMHFLRRAWPDPLTPHGKWFFIHYGQVPVGAAGGIGAPPLPPNPGGMGAAPPGEAASNGGKGQEFGANLPSNNLSNGANSSGLDIETLGGPNLGLGTNGSHKKPTGFGACRSRNQDGPELGGGPIIGVASRDIHAGILVFGGHARPCKWAFIYDPSKDKTLHVVPTEPGGLPNGQPTPNAGGIPGGMTGGLPPPG